MSTYANIQIHSSEFHVTHDGSKENILEELRVYTESARRMARPGHVPEVMVALIAADADDYYSFLHHGFQEWGETFDVTIGPRGGLKIHRRR